MKNEYKYYEFDPGQAVVYLLNETIGKYELNAVSYFLSPNRTTPDMYSCTKGKFKKISNQKPFDLPNREIQDNNFTVLHKLANTPKAIQNILRPQKTLYSYTNHNDYVLQLNFLNIKDNKWDCVYILVDSILQESIKSTLNLKPSTKTSTVGKINDLVLPYFNVSYPMLKEFINIEYKKYQFFDEITSTLEKTIKSKNDLAEEIKDLKNAHKSGLENEIASILRDKSVGDGPRIQLSENAKNYVLDYREDETILIKAVGEAADLVRKMYSLNRTANLEIDLNYIQIHMSNNDDTPTTATNIKKKEKARLYLDKYEEAALLALKFKNKVNIKHIAAYTLPKAVQPPAISANIGKYKDEIRYLLLSYPQKWEVLRSNFSPISAISQDRN